MRLTSRNSGAASRAVDLGVPAIAFSGAGISAHSYTEPDPVSNAYAQVALKVVNAVLASGQPYLPTDIALVSHTFPLCLRSLQQSPGRTTPLTLYLPTERQPTHGPTLRLVLPLRTSLSSALG